MRNQIPYNNVSKDYNDLLNVFIEQLTKIETDNIISIFLTGSFSRGEATESSDLDIWCIFKELNTETLNSVGAVIQNLPVSYDELEINSQCLSLSEFQSGYFSKFLAYPIICLEAVLLWGEDIASEPVQDKEAEKIYKEMLAEILLSVRHYIAVNEPAEKLTFNKIKTWVLKPLMFALRLERYLNTKQYPLAHKDLIDAYDKPPISAIYFSDNEKWNADIQNNHNDVLRALHDEIIDILG